MPNEEPDNSAVSSLPLKYIAKRDGLYHLPSSLYITMSTLPYQVDELIATLSTSHIGNEAIELAMLQVSSTPISVELTVNMKSTGSIATSTAGIPTRCTLSYVSRPKLVHGWRTGQHTYRWACMGP